MGKILIQPRTLRHRCEVLFTSGPFDRLLSRTRGRFWGLAVISDSRVAGLFGRELTSRLAAAHMRHLLITFPPGDRNKSRRTKGRIEDAMVRAGVARDWAVVALGGGVTGDLAGFAAGTYMRGIPWFNIPTTLLAMADASLGGKTSVNLKAGKNLVGLFHQPEAVLIHTGFLGSLAGPRWLDGTAEIIKHAAILDRELFERLERSLPLDASTSTRLLGRIIERSVGIKAGIVNADERELGRRGLLNFGHTIGHGLERAMGYAISHGRAVALGMLVEARISNLAGMLPTSELRRLARLIARAGFRFSPRPLPTRAVLGALGSDKKKRSGSVRFVLLRRIGSAERARGSFTHEVDPALVRRALAAGPCPGDEA
jgi:3-dehydroquinate synthase